MLLDRTNFKRKKWCRACHECRAKKSTGEERRSLKKKYVEYAPLERLAMDIFRPLPLTPHGNKFVVFEPISFYGSREVILVGEFISRFRGSTGDTQRPRHLESKIISEVCKLLDVEKTRKTLLHPLSDGHLEHYNVTVVMKVFGCTIFNERNVGIPSCISSVLVVKRNVPQTKTSKYETNCDLGRSSETLPRSCFEELDF